MLRGEFAVLDSVEQRVGGQTKEFILETNIFELTGERDIVSMPRITPELVWMVPRHDGSFLFINFDVYFL